MSSLPSVFSIDWEKLKSIVKPILEDNDNQKKERTEKLPTNTTLTLSSYKRKTY